MPDRRYLPQYEVYRPFIRRRVVEQSLPAKQDVFTAKKVEENKAEPDFYTKEWVQREVKKVKEKPLRSGETPWWHLSGTGFWVKEQVGQLVRNLKDVGKESFPNVLELELSKVSEDFGHFEREYLLQLASLKWNLAWQDRDGQKRVICPDYKGGGVDQNGSLWSSVTSKDERDGVVYDTLFGNKEKGIVGVEEKLRDAKPGTMITIFSPAGWSGYKDITYPEAQYYVVQVQNDGSLKAITLRIDATIAQIESAQNMMGVSIPEAKDSKQRIKNTIANVAYITPESGMKSFEDVVDVIQKSVDGREVAYGEGHEVSTFSDIKRFIKNPELFATKHDMTDKLNNRFKEYARWRLRQGGSWDAIEMDLQIAVALGTLQLNKAYDMEVASPGKPGWNGLGGSIFESDSQKSISAEYALIQQIQETGGLDYNKEKDKLEEKPGCAGGGGGGKVTDSRYASKYVTTMGSSRAGAPGNGDYSGDKAKDDPNLCRCGQGGGPHFHCPGVEGKSCGNAITVGEGISECACGAGKNC
jgi:hypothetical protein